MVQPDGVPRDLFLPCMSTTFLEMGLVAGRVMVSFQNLGKIGLGLGFSMWKEF